MRAISLHDTRSGAVRPLTPRDPGRVGIYACGPTVYGRVHVGNARPFVVYSLLARFLRHEGYDVTLVMNITDINDKIYDAARPAGVPSAELAREMGAAYRADTDRLGLGRPDHEPLASETVDGIVALIAALIERGHAYASEGDVYFRVRSDAGYGTLSHRALEDLEVAEPGGRKEEELDFALWKAHKPEEDTSWPAPWGEGRPGWHIECSAMAEELLGVGFDVHGGGSDLVFPHHENEAAQTRCARGQELARTWMHVGMVQSGGEKMAKSVGNVWLLHEALDRHGPEALLMYFAGGHYRQPLLYDDERLEEAARRIERIREVVRRVADGPTPEEMRPLLERFLDALANDFNTPAALAALFDWVREANRRAEPPGDADLRVMLHLLGLDALLEAGAGAAGPDAAARELLEARERARAERDFATADRLRDELRDAGWEVRDGPAGPELVPLQP